MNLIKLKSFLKTIWIFLKDNVFGILFAAFGLFAFFFAKNKQDLLSQIIENQKKLSDKHKEELEEIQKVKNEEIEKRVEIERHYQNVLSEIDKNQQISIDKLSKEKEKEVKKIITENVDDPNKMAERINSMFGFSIYNPSNEDQNS